MNTKNPKSASSQDIQSVALAASLQVLLLGAAAILAGTLFSAVILPRWLPGLTTSLVGEAPKVYWYLSRSSALVAFGLLWASMAMGLLISNRLARGWPGGAAAFDLHQYVSLLGLGFGLFHALILMGDAYIQMSFSQIVTPFGVAGYRPEWVGLGQLGFYLWALVVGSFYLRKRIGTRAWRWIHYASFVTFALALVHGLLSGSDTQTLWASGMYWFAAGSLLFLLYYRVLVTVGVRRSNRATGLRPGEAALSPRAVAVENK
ncbi:MAG: hypothetical protein AB1894_28495 [Chloroflexota bacterium]